MKRNTVIVSGGKLEEQFVLPILLSEETKRVIAVDKGLELLYAHKITPDIIVGDFDSIDQNVIDFYRNEKNIPIREFNPVKDASDTEIAVRMCVEQDWNHVILLGGTGSRLDHVLANIQTLKIAADAGIELWIWDSNNRIRLLQKNVTLYKKDAFGKYFSLFPLGGIVENLGINGAKYPLEGHLLVPYDSRCVSNEFAADKVEITFDSGDVILMETQD